MAEAHAEVSGRPVGGRGRMVVRLLGLVGVLSGATALGLAATGWIAQFGEPREAREWVDLIVRTVKVLLLSDIYYDDWKPRALVWLEPARALGVFASLAHRRPAADARHRRARVGLVRPQFHRRPSCRYRRWPRCAGIRRHSQPPVQGPRHPHGEEAPAGRQTPRHTRTPWPAGACSFSHAAARRAKRIVVDEGDDADTWQTAQLAAQLCPKADVLAHITDPWIRDRLSRDRSSTQRPTPRLAPFSYAGGAARQVMLAHPPYLLAQALEAKAQHILIVGFGQVGQEIAREFIVTSITPGDAKMMVTVVDPDAETTLAPDFNGRHEELVKHVDFDFIGGDFRLSDTRAESLFERLKKRAAKAPICAVYVAIDLDHKPLGLAFAIRAMALRHGLFLAPIFVCAQHGAGLPTVRHGIGMVGGPPEVQEEREKQATTEGKLCNLRVVSYGSWPAAFDGAGMLEHPYDTQARRYHEEYSRLYAEAERKTSGAVTGSVTPWSNLPDQLRISNRRAAAHMRAKAFAVGYDLGRWLAADGGYRFTHELPPAAGAFKDEADPDPVMSRLEHQRWMLDRFLDGWRPGGRSDYYRTRKTLVPFEQLAPDEIAKDNAVVETTRLLMKEAASGKRRKV